MRDGGRWGRIVKPSPRREVDEELSFHLDARIRDYMDRGMSEAEARAAATERLGDLGVVRSECTQLLAAERRSEARRTFLNVSWLDFKLGFRMLIKYPGLTVIGGIAMAFAICVGAGAFEFINAIVSPRLPLPDADRIVGIRVVDAMTGDREYRIAHDFAVWQEQLTGVQQLGAFRFVERNLAVPGRGAEPVRVAEVDAAAFQVARVQPLMGRTLTNADEHPAAPPVAVIGADVWRTRFGADPDVIGRVVHLGATQVTIVGVLPADYGFPVADRFWVPLRFDPSGIAPREGPGLQVYGRLAPGVSIEDAQAQLTALTARVRAESPATHEHLRAEVLPYAQSIFSLRPLEANLFRGSNLFVIMLLVLICGNIALLMFARAASREGEIVVRNALGASRGRIVVQLFAEALVLGVVAAFVGLVTAQTGLRWGLGMVRDSITESGGRIPFWLDGNLSPITLLYAILLTLLGAAVAGITPGLKITRGLQDRLRAQGGGTGPKFGGIWTTIIVAQIALTLAFPVAAFALRYEIRNLESFELGVPQESYLTARLELDRGDDTAQAAFDARVTATYQELQQRLASNGSVMATAYADRMPRSYHPARYIEIDAGGAAPPPEEWVGYRTSEASVGLGFFELFDAPILSGRAFTLADIESRADVVIVNEAFVRHVLGGRNPIGRHFRIIQWEETDGEQEPSQWYQIIGVVRDLGTSMSAWDDPKEAAFYHAASPAAAYPLEIALRMRGAAQPFAPRLRAIGADVEPALRIYDPRPLSEANDADIGLLMFWYQLIGGVSLLALVLSLAGIYAVMAFAVARRTREIGIRVALGSDRMRVVLAVLRRPLIQVAGGLAAGFLLATLLSGSIQDSLVVSRRIFVLVGYALGMAAVCLTAAVVPARRALRVQPTEAMRADG